MMQFLKSRGVGFYVSSSAALASLMTLIVYAVYGTAGGGQQYFSVTAVILLALSILAFCAACPFKQTAAWAPFVQSVLVFVAFLVCIGSCYRYFTEVFYGGVNANAFRIMNKWFLVSLILFFISVVASQVGVHMRQQKTRDSAICGQTVTQ